MAQHSGFFNALLTEGVYDRKYNAEDYTSNLAAIISTGVRRSGDDDLKVSSSGLVVTVGIGRAWIDGRWYYNDTAYQVATVTPPVGSLSRIDGIYLRSNTDLSARDIHLVYKTGTPSSNPTAPACVRSDGIYEIQLASITVVPNATNLTVTDTRGDKNVCGWITTPVGYSDYFTSLDSTFNTWFDNVRDTLASVTLFKQYQWRTVTSGTTASVTFSIPQYDPTGVDIINVYVNGLLETPTDDYTLSGSTITFTNAKTADTEIVVICYKSIDGTGLGSVSDEITALQNQVAALGEINDYYYFCNGSTDNEEISTLVQTFLNGSAGDRRQAKIHIVGHFGASNPAAGSGTDVSHYRWFNFETSAPTNRHITLDFYNCWGITILPTDGTFNAVFYGGNYTIEGLTLTAGANNYTNLMIRGTEGETGSICFKDCNIRIYAAYLPRTLAAIYGGIVKDCRIEMININGRAAALAGSNNMPLQVYGGKYYAYTNSSSNMAAAIYAETSASSSAITIFGASFPTEVRSGLYQNKAINLLAGTLTAVGILTQLPLDVASAATANIFGTIAL